MDQGNTVPESQVTHSETSTMPQNSVKVNRKTVQDLLTCAICTKIFREATTINICLHTFCKNCINRKFREEETKCCPVCNKDLGSSPEQFLRPDEKWNNLANTIFPPSNTRRRNATSATSKLKSIMPEVTKACATGTEAMPQHIGMLQKTTSKFHDGSHVAGIRGHLDRTSSHDISNYLSKISKEKEISTMMPEVACNMSEHNAHKDFSETETKFKVQRKKRTTRGRARPISSNQKKDEEKIEHKNVEISLDGVHGSMDSGEACNKTSSEDELSDNEKILTLWFHLVPREDENGHKYPELKNSFIRVKDARDLTVLVIQKFLANRLNLKSEFEVEILCNGHHLDPSLSARSMVDFWIISKTAMAPKSEKEKQKLEEKDFVMELEYMRSINFGSPKQN